MARHSGGVGSEGSEEETLGRDVRTSLMTESVVNSKESKFASQVCGEQRGVKTAKANRNQSVVMWWGCDVIYFARQKAPRIVRREDS